MAKPPEKPGIPTLTRVFKQVRETEKELAEAKPAESPSRHPMPRDLDIDLKLDELDRPSTTPDKPATDEMPVSSADTDETALKARIEQLVDAAIAAHVPALRAQLVDSILRALKDPPPSMKPPRG